MVELIKVPYFDDTVWVSRSRYDSLDHCQHQVVEGNISRVEGRGARVECKLFIESRKKIGTIYKGY